MRRGLALKVVAALYSASLIFVGFRATAGAEGVVLYSEEFRGYKILLWGWLGVFDGTIAWYANPLLAFAILSLWKNPARCARLCVIGFITASSALLYRKMWLDERFAQYANVGHWGLGFYLWLSCFVVVFWAARTAEDDASGRGT